MGRDRGSSEACDPSGGVGKGGVGGPEAVSWVTRGRPAGSPERSGAISRGGGSGGAYQLSGGKGTGGVLEGVNCN